MFERAILPDLRRRVAAEGDEAVIVSRVLRTWGTSESALAEALQGRDRGLGRRMPTGGRRSGTGVTIAFLASGIEGIKVRLTARAATDEAAARRLLDAEEREVRAVLADALRRHRLRGGRRDHGAGGGRPAGRARGLTLGLAESLTGGLMASRLVDVPGASAWFRGAVVSYASDVKQTVLGVPEGPVVSASAAAAMAEGARRVLGAGGRARHHRGRGTRTAGRPAGGDRLRRPGTAGPAGRRHRAAPSRGPPAGPPVRHHLGARPAPPHTARHRLTRPGPPTRAVRAAPGDHPHTNMRSSLEWPPVPRYGECR